MPLARQYRPRLRDVFSQRLLRRFSQRHNAFFIAFAAHQNVAQVELQVFLACARQLRDPQRSGIKHFQHGAIAQRHGLRNFRVVLFRFAR